MEIKGALEDDSDLEEMWVLHKINQYRAVHIVQQYALTNEIDPIWLQRVLKFSYEKVTAADDPSITYNSITLGKAILPTVVSLPEDIGTYRIAGSGAILQFEPCDFNRLMMKAEIGEESHGEYGYYAKLGNIVYEFPYIMEGSAVIVAANPMEIVINNPDPDIPAVGSLGDPTYIPAIIAPATRNLRMDDEYPLDPLLAQRAILDLLTKDMQLADGVITDIINDSQREFKIMKDEQNISGNKRQR